MCTDLSVDIDIDIELFPPPSHTPRRSSRATTTFPSSPHPFPTDTSLIDRRQPTTKNRRRYSVSQMHHNSLSHSDESMTHRLSLGLGRGREKGEERRSMVRAIEVMRRRDYTCLVPFFSHIHFTTSGSAGMVDEYGTYCSAL